MKKEYTAPRAEKLDCDYSRVVTASGSGHGDQGWGHGCKDKPNPGEHGNPTACREG